MRPHLLMVGLILLSLSVGAAGYFVVKGLFMLVREHPHLGVALILLLLMWNLGTTLWLLSKPTFHSDPKMSTEVSEGHE